MAQYIGPTAASKASWEQKKSAFRSQVAAKNFAQQQIFQQRTAAQQQAAQTQRLMSMWQTTQAGARQANIARQGRIESLYDVMEKRVQPGGAFEKAGLGEIETARTRGVGREMQQMISSGMYGTTAAAGIGRGWEAEVGAPARLRLEDVMQQRLTGIQQQKAGFLERIEEPYPDYAMLMQAIMR